MEFGLRDRVRIPVLFRPTGRREDGRKTRAIRVLATGPRKFGGVGR